MKLVEGELERPVGVLRPRLGGVPGGGRGLELLGGEALLDGLEDDAGLRLIAERARVLEPDDRVAQVRLVADGLAGAQLLVVRLLDSGGESGRAYLMRAGLNSTRELFIYEYI